VEQMDGGHRRMLLGAPRVRAVVAKDGMRPLVAARRAILRR
jgi:hypothetical protein